MKVAFQGMRGAYSEEALYRYFRENKKIESQGHSLSEEVFDSVKNGDSEMGIVPVENSIAGNVAINMDLLYQHKVFVIGETYLPINHCLLGIKGSELSSIDVAHSHPIALAQCLPFLKENKIKSIADFDTAGSAKLILNKSHTFRAAIASELCAHHYGLDILAKNIQSVKNNITRFLIFKKETKEIEECVQEKTSMAFKAKNHPGALLNCLQVFKDFNFNLTRLESHPIPENPFEYIFFIDFQAGLNQEKTQECLSLLSKDAKDIRVLGSYAEGRKDLA